MARFVQVTFLFAGVPKVLDLEPVFSAIGHDWVRLNSMCWILWTDRSSPEIFSWLSPYLDTLDNLIIAPIVYNEIFGRMPPWVWTWMGAKNFGNPIQTGEAVQSYLNYFNQLALPKPK
jgi:hypothetical protein